MKIYSRCFSDWTVVTMETLLDSWSWWNPRWRPDFPADRHHRSSPSTRLSFTRRERRVPAARTAAGALRFSGGSPKDCGREGKHRRAPQEELSAVLAPELRSFSSRLSATPAVFLG
ncbi:hypothetical protein NDU88_008849 [Pleurodeles waltl]|uniref:Uncharacterized protein n=1 Tax=Pleurodeles waltl TaxID=8319 RepID=A0AAV7QVX9_PLEWA|nr:hypothetical protein NDU88_008849 [Pleurodeles waltl]